MSQGPLFWHFTSTFCFLSKIIGAFALDIFDTNIVIKNHRLYKGKIIWCFFKTIWKHFNENMSSGKFDQYVYIHRCKKFHQHAYLNHYLHCKLVTWGIQWIKDSKCDNLIFSAIIAISNVTTQNKSFKAFKWLINQRLEQVIGPCVYLNILTDHWISVIKTTFSGQYWA